MSNWDPNQYLVFEQERTRPCRDLVARIPIHPRSIIDLGCGPGNSTSVLAGRWPSATITGLDSSPDMLASAKQAGPHHRWILDSIDAWAANTSDRYDLVFSNAALQWVSAHAGIIPLLMERVAPGGALAFQVPADINAPAHRIMREVAARFSIADTREWFVHAPAFYYQVLAPHSKSIDLWHTTYFHLMPDPQAITGWYKATGMRPFLDALPNDAERARFLAEYTAAIAGEYPPQPDGRILFPFHRLFLVALR